MSVRTLASTSRALLCSPFLPAASSNVCSDHRIPSVEFPSQVAFPVLSFVNSPRCNGFSSLRRRETHSALSATLTSATLLPPSSSSASATTSASATVCSLNSCLRTYSVASSATLCKNTVRVCFIGAPGGGKGTQASWAVRDFALDHISSGDLLRAEVNSKTEIGQQVNHLLTSGELVPDDLMMQVLRKHFLEQDGKSWMLDGYPRTLVQGQALTQLLDQIRQPLHAVLHIDVPESVIVDRVKDRLVHPASGRIYNRQFNPPKKEGVDDLTGEPLIQRKDDQPETVRRRLATYREQTMPLLRYYQEQGILYHIHSPTSPEGYQI
eukprot:CAMPEP_0174237950 /NCGR_PEP_ID=MMETSP0417-20130205/9895_1 /TAXON_ID=242541 /ORGANISM="Mayorella sp, Strain BSH-02190019" /LENGTH=323 /DNA_ID=CAMNT_0015316753 /DNA_START=85 /DNA_END=1053 /DNA_ORIENTATION=+